MDRISHEIRQAKNINIANTTSTTLELNSTDSSGNSVVIKFTGNGGALEFYQNGTFVGNLLTQNVVLNSISFTRISSTSSEGVKIVMTLQAIHSKTLKTETFYDTVVLRGGY